MAKIEAYKFINPGMATDNASEGSLVGRKLVLGYNRIGKTLTGMGSVIKDIENIELARLKNEDLEDQAERRRLQKERDQESEDRTEMNALEKDEKNKSKSKIKGFFGRSKIGKGLLNGFPAWAKALEPLLRLFTEILRITVIKEMLEWFADPANKEKIETFFHKANVIFTKLSKFGNWLINDKLLGGIEKLFGKEKDLGERFSGLWDLTQGILVFKALTDPIGSIKQVLTWIGNFINFFRKKPKVPGADKSKSKTSQNKQRTKSKGSSKGVKGKTSFTKGKFKSTQFRAPVVEGSKNILKKGKWWQKTWQGMKNWGKKGLNNLKTKPLATTGSVLKGTAKGAANLGVGLLLDWGINAAADEWIFKPMQKHGKKVSDNNTEKAIQEYGSAHVLEKLEKDLAAEQSKTPLNKWVNMATLGYGNIFVGPNDTKIKVLTEKIDYVKNREDIVEPKPKKVIFKNQPETKKKSGFWGNLFSGWGNKKKQEVVVPKPAPQTKKKTTSKKWWEIWKDSGGKLKEYGLGGFFKGITKTVGSVFNGVKNAVGGVINTVSNVVSNPIVSTALSFIPGVGPIVQGINAFNALRQGNIMGAVMSGVGALGSFANINTVNAISQPRWMQNLRFSKFGQGLANMYHSGANAWGAMTAGVNNFMGSKWGSLAKGVYQGATGGGWGGALSAGSNILGMNDPGGLFGEGGFFGEGGRMANMGNWLQEHNLAGIGNMFPGLAGIVNSVPGFANLPGIQDIFAGGFSPMQAIGGLAEKNGMGGLYKSAMGLLGGGDMYTGLKEMAGEIGVSPEALGAVEKGKSLYDRAKSVALSKDPVEILPIVMPIIEEKIVISPAVKEKAVIFQDIYNSFAARM